VIGNLQCIVVDCPDVRQLVRFYQALIGGTVNRADQRWSVGNDFATLHTESGFVFAFQRVQDYQAAQWPDSAHPQQFHVDVDVPDLDLAQQQVLDLGATLLRVDARGWRVFADPAGHPFCLLPSR
jgi:catechol 2,3-dioxygenase-like lactoylglutathione lyase family enzyme